MVGEYTTAELMILPEFAIADGDTTGRWDGDRLLQAFSTLVSNAVQHARGDGPVLVRVDGTDDDVVIDVHNEGVIPPEFLPVIFEPFRNKARDHLSGSLGLYIAEHIVTAHDGTIAVESEKPRGTTFTVTLPHHLPGG